MIDRPDSLLVRALYPSPNHEPRRGRERADMLLLHYTGMMSAARAIDWLARPEAKVSCHYVVDVDGAITQMVPECRRAWHAGVSSWMRDEDINSASIGIEIQNPGHDLGYPDFPEAQMRAIVDLSRDIVVRNAIPATRVLGHADVAPGRKIDPGEKFDWRRMWQAGVGHWCEPEALDPADAGCGLGDGGPIVDETLRLLAEYGYGVKSVSVLDAPAMAAIRSFQLHFRPARPDGRADASTLATLRRLIATAVPVA